MAAQASTYDKYDEKILYMSSKPLVGTPVDKYGKAIKLLDPVKRKEKFKDLFQSRYKSEGLPKVAEG